MRECTALQEAGYHVDLIAIQDVKQPDLPLKESPAKNFTVYRVKTGYPDFFKPLMTGMRYMKRSKPSLLLISIIFLLLLLFSPLPTLIVSLMVASIFLKKSADTRSTHPYFYTNGASRTC